MDDKLNVTISGKAYEFNDGAVLNDVVESICEDPFKVLLCRVNGKLKELFKKVNNGDDIEFVTYEEEAGRKAYERGLQLVFLKALYNTVPRKQIKKASLDYGLGRSVYCSVSGFEVTEELLVSVKALMTEYIEKNFPIIKKVVPTSEAIEIFNKVGMKDKVNLFKFRRESNTNLYYLDNFVDYFYGYMPYSTGRLMVFDVQKYEDGILLVYPTLKDSTVLGKGDDRKNLFTTLDSSSRWAQDLGIATVGDLNEYICKNKASDLILIAEALHEKKLSEIAASIKSRGNVKFVMIAGPSSSGKTTFSHRLSIHLTIEGFKPHPIALDNYYKDRSETPKDENGNYDFECLEALDVKLFNEDMTKLLKGETVEMPTFNFKTGKREYKGDTLKLGKEDILVIEGIHGINDKLSYSLPSDSKFKVYISDLTQINIDEHNRISTTDGRLLRRMVRDARTRGTSAKDTIAMWPSVRRGEENYIFPNQETADVMFNSALLYELAVIKPYAEPLLFGIEKGCPEYEKAKSLLKFLSYFLAIPPEDIPKHSIMREFIGGSYFNV